MYVLYIFILKDFVEIILIRKITYWINFVLCKGFYQYESMFPDWKKELMKRKDYAISSEVFHFPISASCALLTACV